MGSGIAQNLAQIQKSVIVFDVRAEALKKAKDGIQKSLEKLASKNLIQEKPEVVLSRLTFSEDLQTLSKVDCVIEAVTEDFHVKTGLFKEIEKIASKDCIFASNTSSISITKIASTTLRPEKVIGMHFMNPVPIMKLVEMIPGQLTNQETLSSIRALAEEMGKTVVTSKDKAGFIVNRILMPMINEAAFAVQEGLASVEDIDIAMKLGTNQPMGPLALADYIGLDTCLFIMGVMHEGLGDEKYVAAPVLKKYVESGWLGKKSGKGFYTYSKDSK